MAIESKPSAPPWPAHVGAAMVCAPIDSPTDTRQPPRWASPPKAVKSSLWSTNSSEYLALAASASASAASAAKSLSCFGSRSGTPSQRPGWWPRSSSLNIRSPAMSLGGQQYLTASRGLSMASAKSHLAVKTRLPSPSRTGPNQKHSIARFPSWPLRVSAPFLACFSSPSKHASQVRSRPHSLPRPHNSTSAGVAAAAPPDGAQHPHIVNSAQHPYNVEGAQQSYLVHRTPAGGGVWVGGDILDSGERGGSAGEQCSTKEVGGMKQGSGLHHVRNAVYDSARPERNSLSSSSLGTWSPRDQLGETPATHSRRSMHSADLVWEDADAFELTCTADSLSPFACVGLTCSMTDTEEPMSQGDSAGGAADAYAMPARRETPAPLTHSDACQPSSMRSCYGERVWLGDVAMPPPDDGPQQAGQEDVCVCNPGKEVGLNSGNGSEIRLAAEDDVMGAEAEAEKEQVHVGGTEQGEEVESVEPGDGVEGVWREAVETLSDTGFWADDEETSGSDDGEDSIIRDDAGFEIAGIPGLGEGTSSDVDVWVGTRTQHDDNAIMPVAFGSVDMLCDMVDGKGGSAQGGPPPPAYCSGLTAHTPGGVDTDSLGPAAPGQEDATPPPYSCVLTAHTPGDVAVHSPEPDARGQAVDDAPRRELDSLWQDDDEQFCSDALEAPGAGMQETRPRLSLPSPFSTGNLGWVSRCSGSGRVSGGIREDAQVVWDGEALVVREGRIRTASAPLPLAVREGGCLRRASSEDSIASFACWLG